MSADSRLGEEQVAVLAPWVDRLFLMGGASRGVRPASLRADRHGGADRLRRLVPSAMAYGELAGVSSEAGLYAALASMVVYALLGTSRQLMIGPETTSALLAATAVAR